MEFGELLAQERLARGVSQLFLAGLAGTTQRHLSFLETGRARPTRQMLMRLGEALELGPARRSGLFEAAGFISPYKTRSLSDLQITATIGLIERQVLCNWPYGAFALTPEWDVLLANPPGAALLGTTPEGIKSGRLNFFDLLVSPGFRSTVHNWDHCAAAIYARMRRHAQSHPEFRPRLESALASGALQGDLDALATQREMPPLLPLEFKQPDGSIQRLTSLSAHFTSVHDEIISGIEIELLLPLDQP